MRKTLVALVIFGIAGFVVYRYFTTSARKGNDGRDHSGAVAVEVAKVELRDMRDTGTFTGSVRASERFDAASKIAGLLKELRVDIGDSVSKGDVIAVLDDDEYVLQVDQARASLAVAEATSNDAFRQQEIARRDFERLAALHKENVISAQEYDRSEATYKAREAQHETAKAQEKLAQASLKAAEVRLGYTRVLADWEGGDGESRLIGQRFVDTGAMIRANDPIVAVIGIDTVKAMINITEKDYPKISIGYPAAVTTDAFPGRVFPGEVVRIAQELADLTREAEVEVQVRNPDRLLKPGMFIRVAMEFSRRDNVAAVPVNAVVRRDDGNRGLFIADADTNQAVFSAVTEGIVDRGWVELQNAGGLVGKTVVTLGQHLLNDNTKLIIAQRN